MSDDESVQLYERLLSLVVEGLGPCSGNIYLEESSARWSTVFVDDITTRQPVVWQVVMNANENCVVISASYRVPGETYGFASTMFEFWDWESLPGVELIRERLEGVLRETNYYSSSLFLWRRP